ncbi:Nuclear pore complex protein Nup50 [Morella rubra]|uniref:Nuclear pore complex protein Nup50 n=1 Tax=Morella rubra TaxID=262757 RepID=A0A6A1W2Y1_9ROSI|nr:Nuclear pore complex protein Nup50 [Morella rubra]
MAGSAFDVHGAEPPQQWTETAPLDMQRAISSWQHVRALNTQFASWVQGQLKNHPDELWDDGVRDYLAHTSNIMEKFSDVVKWLKANAVKGGSSSAVESQTIGSKMVSETKTNGIKSSHEKTGFAPLGATTSFPTSGSSGTFSSSQTSGLTSVTKGTQFATSSRSGMFSNSQTLGSSPAGTTTTFSNPLSSGVFSNSQTSGSTPAAATTTFSNSLSSGAFSNSQIAGSTPASTNTVFATSPNFGVFSNTQTLGFTPAGTAASFANPFSSGVFSNIQKPIFFGGSQSSLTVTQSPLPAKCDASDDADGENELEQPSSPSVKKTEEKGIVVVHEVKCKLYVKSSDGADKDAWKEKGMGQLSIKCKEGVDKGTRESKPTIIVRNDVGKLLLNALLYPGIKTNIQKNSLVAIFHSSGDVDGNDGGNSNNVVARTFLIRTKTEEDRNKLATAIQEYAPAS